MEIFSLAVIGEAMAPNIVDGDEVVVNPSERPKGNGKDIAVLKKGGTNHICRYTNFGDQVLLIHDNGPIIPIKKDQIEVLGKVIDGDYITLNEKNHYAGNEVALG